MMDDHGLTPGQARIIKEGFQHFDKNGDKVISKDELGPVLRAIGQNPTQKAIDEYMQKADTDGSGTLSYDEFVKLVEQDLMDEDEIQVELKQAFLFFDKDKDGHLNIQELFAVLTSIGECLTEKEAEEIFKMADVNGDGKLNAEEFTKLLCQRI